MGWCPKCGAGGGKGSTTSQCSLSFAQAKELFSNYRSDPKVLTRKLNNYGPESNKLQPVVCPTLLLGVGWELLIVWVYWKWDVLV